MIKKLMQKMLNQGMSDPTPIRAPTAEESKAIQEAFQKYRLPEETDEDFFKRFVARKSEGQGD